MDSLVFGEMKFNKKLVLMSIMALLIVLISIGIFSHIRRTHVINLHKESKARDNLKFIGMCINIYMDGNGKIPNSIYEAVGGYGVGVPTSWKNSGNAIDPWETPYKFKYTNKKIQIWSCGENLLDEIGSGDDIIYEFNARLF